MFSRSSRSVPTSYTSHRRISQSSISDSVTRICAGVVGKAYDERAFEVFGFPLLYEALRDEPRYRQLLSRMGLAGKKGISPKRSGDTRPSR
jgi:hypothetical protein